MYFVKKGFKYLKKRIGRTILLGVIFLVIANFVLAGLLVRNASEKAQVNTRISIGADIEYIIDWEGIWADFERGTINDELASDFKRSMYQGIISNEIITKGGAPSYKNFMEAISSEYVESYDIGPSFVVLTDEIVSFSLDAGEQQSGNSSFEVKLFIAQEPNDFKTGDAELIDGRHASQNEIDNGTDVILIEENIAELNDLRVGDDFTVSTTILEYENTETEYKIIGIYRTNEGIDPKMPLPQNRFYAPLKSIMTFGVVQEEIENILISPNVISLRDPLDVEAYKEEMEKRIDFKYGTIDANDDLYDQLMGPIDSLGNISGILVLIITIAGALIIGLITALTVNDRKEEIGILLALGEQRLKIVSQFVMEVIVIALITFALSTFTGGYIGERISDAVLNSDVLQTQEADAKKDIYKKEIGKNEDLEADVDIDLNATVLLQLLGLGIALSAVSTIVPSLYVMRFNPKQILTNKT